MLPPQTYQTQQDAPSTSGLDADQMTRRALARLHKLIADSLEGVTAGAGADGSAGADGAAAAAGVPLPEVDAELLPLQQQVDAALARLNARRLKVPALVEAATAAERAAARAALGADASSPADAATADADAAAAPSAPAPPADDVEAVLRRTTAATDRLPAVRARLEEALHRLQTNLAVLGEADGSGGAQREPRTVEKVMRAAARTGPAADQDGAGNGAGGEGGADGGAAAEGGAAETGADATRRCLARELLA